MAKQTINLGAAPSGVGGDTRRSAFVKCNANFDELYGMAVIETGSNANGRYSKFADGTMIMVRPQIVTRVIGATEYAALSFPTPHSMVVQQELAALMFTAVPSLNNDHYGVISAYPDSADGVTAIIRNGPAGQTFTVRCTIICRWK